MQFRVWILGSAVNVNTEGQNNVLVLATLSVLSKCR